MYITTHAPVGAIIGKLVPNPFLAFILGILSHYILDIIPHGDKKFINELKEWLGIKKYIAIIVADAFFLIITLLIIIKFTPDQSYWSVTAGIIGSIIPDFANGIGWLVPKRYLKPFFTSHHLIHDVLANKITRYDFPNRGYALFLVEAPIYILALVIFYLL
jgi:hypothetical protein